MEELVLNMEKTYDALMESAFAVAEARESQSETQVRAALESYANNEQLFYFACDRAQEILESVRQRMCSECIIDEATGPIASKLAKMTEEGTHKQGVAPLSATRLEQLSKTVRGLVLDLQQGAPSAATLSEPFIWEEPLFGEDLWEMGLNNNLPIDNKPHS